jgi:hypothetical protein
MPGPGPTATIAPTAGPRFQRESQDAKPVDGGQAPRVLTTIEPPSGWESYTVRTITKEEAEIETAMAWQIELDDATDYRIVAPYPIRRHIRLRGGRNIVWIGGHISIAFKQWFPESDSSQNGLRIVDGDAPVTDRIVHLEGIQIDGEDLTDAIRNESTTAKLQFAYIRTNAPSVRSSDQWFGTQMYQGHGGSHPDGFQTFYGARSYNFENCTFLTASSGMNLEESNTFSGNDAYLKNVNFRAKADTVREEGPYTDTLDYTEHVINTNFNTGIGSLSYLPAELTESHDTTTPINGAGSLKVTYTSDDIHWMRITQTFGSATDRSQGNGIGVKIRLDEGGGDHCMARIDIDDETGTTANSDTENWHLGQSRKLELGQVVQIFSPFPQHVLKNVKKIRISIFTTDPNTPETQTTTVTIDDIAQATGTLTNRFYGSNISMDGKWGIRIDTPRDLFGTVHLDNVWGSQLPRALHQDGVNYNERYWDPDVTPVTPTLQAEGATSAVTTGVPSVTIPTHQADDILLVSACIWAPNTLENVAEIPTPSGWEVIANRPHQVGTLKIDGYHALFWKRATAPGETVTLTRGAGWDTGTDTCFGARAYVVRGCRTGDVPFSTIQEAGPYTTANQNLPAFRINDYNHLAMVFASQTAVGNLLSAATGYTVGTQDTDTAGTDCNFQTARIADPDVDIAAVASTTTAPATGSYMFFGVAFKGTSNYVDDKAPPSSDFGDYWKPEPSVAGSDGNGSYLEWTSSGDDLYFRDWAGTGPAKVYEGVPAQGDFCPEAVAGVNYATAGWDVPTAVNLTAATETDTAQAVTFTKTIVKTLTPATEMDVAQGLDTDHYVTLGVATETDTAQALDADKAATVTTATETDTAQAVSFTQEAGGVTLTPAVETDAAQALNVDKAKTLTAATEADAAQSLRVPKLTAAVETDAAQALDKDKASTLSPAAETDSAQALSVTKTIFKSLTAATETDAAQAVDKDKSKSLTASSETDTAQALSVTKTIFKSLTAAVETDQAQELSISQAGSFDLVPAQTTDTAQPLSITHIHYRTVGIAAEVDTAQAVAFTKTIYKTLGIASEADVAQAIDRDKTVTVSTATETDGAQALTTFKSDTLGPASETDAAQALSITHVHFRSVTATTETDEAQALSYGINLPWTYTVDENATYDNVDNWTYENEDTFSYSP